MKESKEIYMTQCFPSGKHFSGFSLLLWPACGGKEKQQTNKLVPVLLASCEKPFLIKFMQIYLFFFFFI